MALDPSLSLQVQPVKPPDQLGALAQVMGLVNAQQGVRLGDLQYFKLQRDLADEEETKAAYAAYTRDPSAVSLSELASKNPKLVQDILKQQRETLKDNAQIDKDKAEAELKRFEVGAKKAERAANILSSATDQATYELAKSALLSNFGPGATEGLPDRYDPAVLTAKVQEGMSLKDRLQRQFEDRKLVWEQGAKKVDQGIAQQNADSSRISAGASVMSAGAAQTQAKVAIGRLGLETAKLAGPEGAPFEVTNKATGEKALVYRTGSGALLDANTRKPVAFDVAPKAENITPEGASRVALMKQGRQDVEEAKKILFDDKGKLNKGTAFLMKASGPFGVGSGGWGEDATKAYSRVYNAVAAKLRMETGAAAPQSEVDDIARRFMPSIVRDSDGSALDKLNRLQEFMDMGLVELERGGYVKPGTAFSERAPDPAKFGLKPVGK